MRKKFVLLGIFCGASLLLISAVPSMKEVTSDEITETFTGSGLEAPTAGVVNSDGNCFVCSYTDSTNTGSVSYVDTSNGDQTKITPNDFEKSPIGIALLDDTGYFIAFDSWILYRFNAVSNTMKTNLPFNSLYSPSSMAIYDGKAYILCHRSGYQQLYLVVIDLTTEDITYHTITTDLGYTSYFPGTIAITDDGIAVINASAGVNSFQEIVVIAVDLATNTRINAVVLSDTRETAEPGQTLYYVQGVTAVTGNKAYISNFYQDRVDVLEVSSSGVTDSGVSIDNLSGPVGVFANSNDEIYVGNFGTFSSGSSSTTVTVISSLNDTISRSISGFSSPNAIFGEGPDGEVYVMENTLASNQTSSGTFIGPSGGLRELSSEAFRLNRGAFTRRKGAF